MSIDKATDNPLVITDSEQRERAIDPLRSCIVQAPAGSGKTTLLAERFVALLAGVKQPEQILAITFTKKAAAEMRTRIRKELADPTSVLGKAAMVRSAEMGWGLDDYPSRLRIQTIDSFAMSLVKQLPITSKLHQRDICDHPGEYYERAVARVLQRVSQPDEANTTSSLIRDFDGNIVQVQNLLITMLGRREQWLFSLTDKLANFSPDGLIDAISEGIAQLQVDALNGLLQTISLPARHKLQEFARYASDSLGEKTAFAELTEYEQWRFIATHLVLIAGATLEDPKVRRALNKNNGFPPTKDNNHKQDLLELLAEFAAQPQYIDMLQALAAIRDIPDLQSATQDRDRITVIGTMLLNCVTELNDLFDEQGEVDYNQITIAAITALGTDDAPTELALSLDYRISHLLIDEFQDTSRAQHTLFERLIREWTPTDNTSFFAVGDPMQSIYRFRNAEVSLFLEVCNNGIGNLQLEHLQLSTNFRSCDSMITWFNQVFRGVLGDRDDTNLGRISYAQASSPRGALVTQSKPQLLEAIQVSDDVTQQHQQIIDHIQKLANDQGSALTDIAILVRNRTPVAALVHALETADIAWQGTELYGLAETAIVSDLVTLANTLFDPADRISAFALLRSPLVGLNLNDLFALANYLEDELIPQHTTLIELVQHASQEEVPLTLAGVSEDGNLRLLRLISAARLPLQDRLQLTPRELIESIWLQLAGPAAYPASQLKHAERLLDTIELNHPIHFSPPQLKRDILDLYAEDDGTGVQILTVHKSKGLQYKHVLLPRIEAGTRSDSAALMLQRSTRQGALIACKASNQFAHSDKKNKTVYNWLKLEDGQRALNETRRVLYVGATRAEESLRLFASIPADKASATKGSLLACLNGVLNEFWNERNSDTDAGQSQTNTPGKSLGASDSHADPIVVIEALPATLPPPKRSAPQVKLPDRSRNIAGRQELDEPDMLFAVERRAAILRGTLTHQALCTITQTLNHTDDWANQDSSENRDQALQVVSELICNEQHLWLQQALQLGLNADQADGLVSAVKQQLEHTAHSQLGRWCALSPHIDSQAEFALTLWENAGPVALVIDRTFAIDRPGQPRVRWIIDYKTAAPETDEAKTDDWLRAEVNRYAGQLSRYARALRAIHPNQLIRTALYFTATGELWETAIEDPVTNPAGDELAAPSTPTIELKNGTAARNLTYTDVTT